MLVRYITGMDFIVNAASSEMSVFIFLKITAPLWLNADILAGPVNATTKPVGKTKLFSS